MSSPELLVLPADVVVAPIADLSAELKEQFAHQPGDYYVTRPRTRTVSSVINADTARLIGFFRTPMTIVDAVIACSSENNLDPRETLDSAFETLAALIESEMLVDAGSKMAAPVEATLAPGSLVDGVEIIETVHVLGDTEVYRARTAAGANVSLKIAGVAATKRAASAIRHEAAVIAGLDGQVNPPLEGAGEFDGRSFVVTTWREGVDLYSAALELRNLGGSDGLAGLVAVAGRVLDAYAHLHEQGVLHGDVHPRNILIGPQGDATIIDYGLATGPGGRRSPLIGGIDLFQAPEVARAHLGRLAPPAPSPQAEQYSLGALVYQLLTGGHVHAFSLEPDEMWRQVIEDQPLSFDTHGVSDLPSVEASLQRALSKDPAERYSSVRAMLNDFRRAAEIDRASRAASPSSPPATIDGGPMVDGLLVRLHVPGELWLGGLAAPEASVTYGAAGLGYALLRLARVRGDATLLADADIWSTRAAASIPTERAFWNSELGIVPEIFGRASLFHHAAGVHCVEALIAHARGDDSALKRGVGNFIAASTECEHVDVAFGRSGLLIACALLVEVLPPSIDSSALVAFGNDLMGSIWSQLDSERLIPESIGLRALGAAHGWSGILFSALRWCESSKASVPPQLAGRLAQLASMGQPAGRAMRWPRTAGEPVSDQLLTASWCNGSAGHALLWTAAARRWRQQGYERLAEMAGWSAFEDSAQAPGNLCCGLAGRAYALLALYRQTDDRNWLARARILGSRAFANPGVEAGRINSLYHGEPGIAVLSGDLQTPEFASMPLYEAEGWPI